MYGTRTAAAAGSGSSTEGRPRRHRRAAEGRSDGDEDGGRDGGRDGGSDGGSDGGEWREDAGLEKASRDWVERTAVLEYPAGAWAKRRHFCAASHGCDACAGFVAEGVAWRWAPMSQRLLDTLASPGAYGSHAAAHASGWRWHASPNHGQRSHAHQWWPPQAAVDAHAPGAKLPLGTYKAFDVLDAMF